MSNKAFKLLTDKMGGRPANTYIGTGGDIFYDPVTGALRISDGTAPGGHLLVNTTHGCFHKLADVTAPAANTVYGFDWHTDTNAHIDTNGVTVSQDHPTRLSIATPGTYNVFAEMQIKNTVTANRECYIWLAKNGVDISESCVKVEIKQGGSSDAYQLFAKQWVVGNINADDYLELRFVVSNPAGISLEYSAAQTTPYARPAVPSATITITAVQTYN